MPLRLTMKRRDVFRIGDVLIGVDYEDGRIVVIIDDPKKTKVTRIPQGMTQPLAKLRAVQPGIKPRLIGANAEPEPAA